MAFILPTRPYQLVIEGSEQLGCQWGTGCHVTRVDDGGGGKSNGTLASRCGDNNVALCSILYHSHHNRLRTPWLISNYKSPSLYPASVVRRDHFFQLFCLFSTANSYRFIPKGSLLFH